MKLAQPRTRSFKYDNLKALLIFLVVFGHFLTPISTTDFWAKIFYMLIFVFHMPAFLYIVGKFAKPNIKKIIIFLILYLVFQVIYTPFLQRFDDPSLTWSITTPQWGLWYLITLITYYALSFVLPSTLSNKEKNIWIMVSFIIAIIAGFIPYIGEPFSLSRSLVFLPFFLMGRWSDNNEDDKNKRNKSLLYGMSGTLLALIYMFGSEGNRGALYQKADYITVNSTWYWRALALIIAVLLIKFLLNSIPNKQIPIITYIGQNTLIIFLFHGFFVKLFHYYVQDFTLLTALLLSIITITVITGIHFLFKKAMRLFIRSSTNDM